MSLKQHLRYLEKQYLRPLIRRIRGRIPTPGFTTGDPARLEALEARMAELEHLIQEDLGLRLSEPPTSPHKPNEDV